MNKIEQALIQEIALITGLDAENIDTEAPLHSMGMDSLKFVELLVSIEKKFGVKLMESGMTREDFFNVRALAQAITKHS